MDKCCQSAGQPTKAGRWPPEAPPHQRGRTVDDNPGRNVPSWLGTATLPRIFTILQTMPNRVGMSRRAGFDPFPPPSDSGRVGTTGATRRASVGGPRSQQNGRVPRRNNARKSLVTPTEDPHRVAGLGEHWRADGLPKAAYPSQRDALAVAQMRRQESGADLHVYRCDVCGAWHMGKQRGESSRSRR
jgi:hypothetical protein